VGRTRPRTDPRLDRIGKPPRELPACDRANGPPAHYLSSSYYEHWLTAVETLLVEAGTLSQDELGRASATAVRRENPALESRVRTLLSPFPVRDREAGDARFLPGEHVLVRRLHAPGHTRCPRYVRGVAGAVQRVHEFALLPDDPTAPPEPYYTVVFDSADVWGRGAERFAVSVDLFQSYLEEVP
jgi:nitrile hydratase